MVSGIKPLQKGRVELLVASSLVLVAQTFESKHADFVDSTIKTISGSELLSIFVSSALMLSNAILNRPNVRLIGVSHGESQLLRTALWTLVQMTDHSVLRPLMMNQGAQILAQVLLLDNNLFFKRYSCTYCSLGIELCSNHHELHSLCDH